MTLRRALLALGSLGLAAILIVSIIRLGHVNLHMTMRAVESANRIALIKLVFLNVVLVLISTGKWRSVDAVLRADSDFVPSKTMSFAVTGVGMAMGLILPPQIGMAAARTAGTCLYGRPLKRGTVGTVFEQSFDVVVFTFLAVASGITWLCRGRIFTWLTSALLMLFVAFFLVGPGLRLIGWLASRAMLRDRIASPWPTLSKFQDSALSDVRLARRLFVLSVLRYLVVVLMASETAEAIRSTIPLWNLAAAVPFAFISNVIALTPGGVGVNEITSAAALRLSGTPLIAAAQWVLANRILGTAACFLVAVFALVAVGAARVLQPQSVTIDNATTAQTIRTAHFQDP